MAENTNISQAVGMYLDRLKAVGKSKQTVKAYHQGINRYLEILEESGVDIHGPLDQLSVETYDWMLSSLQNTSNATRKLYTSAVTAFFEYLSAMNLISINFHQIAALRKSATPTSPPRLPQFSKENIQKVLDYAQTLKAAPYEDELDHLRNLRDRALLISLADTGLRIHEACKLTRGAMDFNEGRAIIIGKGNKEAVIRFTSRSLRALREYIEARAALDGASGKPLHTLPVFMRHDRPLGKKSKHNQYQPLSTQTGRDVVNRRVRECLGPDAVGTITPHSFRHYFVTVVLNATNNMRIAQELARHSSITTTSRYAHLSNQELDQAYYEAFEE
jgi:site-specific recombinase XerD